MLNYDNLFLKTDLHVKKTRVTKSPRKHPLALKPKERSQREKVGNTNEQSNQRTNETSIHVEIKILL